MESERRVNASFTALRRHCTSTHGSEVQGRRASRRAAGRRRHQTTSTASAASSIRASAIRTSFRRRRRRPCAATSSLTDHANAAHDRTVARYEQTYGSLTQKEEMGPSPQPTTPTPTTVMVEPPLAALVRTAITTALSKSALRLFPALIKLQRANGTAILEMNKDGSGGVQTFLHAAAVVLQRRQNGRLCAAGMLSKMGDGSSDRKTTEQVTMRAEGRG